MPSLTFSQYNHCLQETMACTSQFMWTVTKLQALQLVKHIYSISTKTSNMLHKINLPRLNVSCLPTIPPTAFSISVMATPLLVLEAKTCVLHSFLLFTPTYNLPPTISSLFKAQEELVEHFPMHLLVGYLLIFDIQMPQNAHILDRENFRLILCFFLLEIVS